MADRHPITTQSLVCNMPAADRVEIARDLEFRAADGNPLPLDLYSPADRPKDAQLPAVIVVTGFPDQGAEKRLGCKFKEMEWVTSWARLFADLGLVGIAYSNRDPQADLHALFDHIRQHAALPGIDSTRIGVWATSGNVPLALSLLMRDARRGVKCAALCYGFMLDLDGETGVAEAAKTWGFVNASAGKSIDDLERDVPIFVARAGQDQFAHLNDALDRFVSHAVGRNLPLTVVNHPEGPHAFDLFHDSDVSRHVISQILSFLRFNLR